MGLARIGITSELILEALGFPATTAIRGARMSADGRNVVLIVEHEDLKPSAEGQDLPVAIPRFRHQHPIVLVDWGQY